MLKTSREVIRRVVCDSTNRMERGWGEIPCHTQIGERPHILQRRATSIIERKVVNGLRGRCALRGFVTMYDNTGIVDW